MEEIFLFDEQVSVAGDCACGCGCECGDPLYPVANIGNETRDSNVLNAF